MGIINISDIKAGMKLAGPVINQKGILLLPEGIQLTEKHLFLLESWGITEANIDGVSAPEENLDINMLDPDDVSNFEEKLKKRFPQETEDNEIMAEIFRITKKLGLTQMLQQFYKKESETK